MFSRPSNQTVYDTYDKTTYLHAPKSPSRQPLRTQSSVVSTTTVWFGCMSNEHVENELANSRQTHSTDHRSTPVLLPSRSTRLAFASLGPANITDGRVRCKKWGTENERCPHVAGRFSRGWGRVFYPIAKMAVLVCGGIIGSDL